LEVISCGGFLLTNKTKWTTETFGNNIGTFEDNEDDLINSIEKYIELPDDELIYRASEARKKVVAEHDWTDRVSTIIDIVTR